MKPKKRSKSRKTLHVRKKVKGNTRNRTRPSPRPTALPATGTLAPTSLSSVNTCEEIEVGDLGGFGSTEELEAHEKRCGQEATEVCHTCARNLCNTHYELLHKDHDATLGHNTSQGLTAKHGN